VTACRSRSGRSALSKGSKLNCVYLPLGGE
jgi:hypothetical protein